MDKIKDEYHAIVEAIVCWLPDWRINYLAEHLYNNSYEVIAEGGKKFYIYANHYDAKGKLRVSGLGHRIQVSPTRTAQSIAADIERRFLPKFLELYEKGVKTREAQRARRENISIIKAMFERLLIIPKEMYSQFDFRLDEGSLQIERELSLDYCDYSNYPCTIKIRTSVDDAAAILAAINHLTD